MAIMIVVALLLIAWALGSAVSARHEKLMRELEAMHVRLIDVQSDVSAIADQVLPSVEELVAKVL